MTTTQKVLAVMLGVVVWLAAMLTGGLLVYCQRLGL